jgi:hypothetical protein
MQKSTEMEQERVRAQGELNYTAFASAIARISYCTAVSLLGLDGFEHLDLPDLILGKYPHVPHYVGVMRTDPEPPEPRGELMFKSTTAAGRIIGWYHSASLRTVAT